MTSTRVVAYVRVSSTDQADNGHSLATQREKVELYARLHSLELVEIIEDAGVSAKTLERPGLTRALAMLDAGEATALLVPKLDRLTRSVRDLGELIDRYFAEGKKAALLSVADSIDTRSAAGRLVLNVLASVSQWEREAIAERTRDTMRSMKAQGKVVSRPTLGFDTVDGRLVENADEKALIARICAMHTKGASYNAIAGRLNAEGVPTKRGGQWQPTTVRNLILRSA
ncbi:recombinase family protein [Azospirillum brasilense]|uniref:Recombinase family protein n=1 Tax=Azospirillum brasilense TaxID=192 RepID=A0A0P0ELL6_AZOBR|nr:MULTISPECIES: recombinase family protein [Azospirillum]ALJ36905.1 recombinase [Azospirillum brasilense]MDW7551577.1 recombinase family protein [Azospirillum brasilense]MDW7591012.1 recombinase family protein [Azospirillum brasilense]MDW7632716.1 recombinase family protein [Azospirillum brasilense]MDX5951470.1 recombinase family protein [Azospirillum brasilense]